MRRPAVSFAIKLKKGTDHSVPNRKILILGRCRVVDRAVCPLFQRALNPRLSRGARFSVLCRHLFFPSRDCQGAVRKTALFPQPHQRRHIAATFLSDAL
jgi:hypothetical protein